MAEKRDTDLLFDALTSDNTKTLNSQLYNRCPSEVQTGLEHVACLDL
jgi:hypothetical protein